MRQRGSQELWESYVGSSLSTWDRQGQAHQLAVNVSVLVFLTELFEVDLLNSVLCVER
jgi:hypothetical protein